MWCVKYRRKVLIDDIEKTLKELLIEISNENNTKIIEMKIDLDHIHILIECSPQHFIPNILKIFKGISARKLNEENIVIFSEENLKEYILIIKNLTKVLKLKH